VVTQCNVRILRRDIQVTRSVKSNIERMLQARIRGRVVFREDIAEDVSSILVQLSAKAEYLTVSLERVRYIEVTIRPERKSAQLRNVTPAGRLSLFNALRRCAPSAEKTWMLLRAAGFVAAVKAHVPFTLYSRSVPYQFLRAQDQAIHTGRSLLQLLA